VVVLAVALFVAVAVVLILLRRPIASAEGAVMGGRLPPGCVVAQGVLLLIAAGVLFFFRNRL
jgi:hypothetical protein